MSNTPETDAALYRSCKYDGEEIPGFDHTDADFARDLERQRNMLLEALEVYLQAGHKESRRAASVIAKEAIASVKKSNQ